MADAPKRIWLERTFEGLSPEWYPENPSTSETGSESYVLKTDADLLAEALEEIIGAMVDPDDEPNSILIQIGARAEDALTAYEEGNA